MRNRDFPGYSVVTILPPSAGGAGSIPGQAAKIPHASPPGNQNIKQKQTNKQKRVRNRHTHTETHVGRPCFLPGQPAVGERTWPVWCGCSVGWGWVWPMSRRSLTLSLGQIPGSFSSLQSIYLWKVHSIVILITKDDEHTGSVILYTVLDVWTMSSGKTYKEEYKYTFWLLPSNIFIH